MAFVAQAWISERSEGRPTLQAILRHWHWIQPRLALMLCRLFGGGTLIRSDQ